MATLPPIAAVAAILIILPLPSQIQAKNVALISLIAWLFIANVCEFISSSLWYHDVSLKAITWCDISTKLQVGVPPAVAACIMCLSRQLELIVSDRGVTFSHWRRQLIEASFCVGLPIVLMALHFIVQQGRFDIIEDIGCVPSTDNTAPAIAIVWLPPLLLYFVSFIYTVVSLAHIVRHRVNFATHIRTYDLSLTVKTYFFLFFLSVIEMILGFMTSITTLVHGLSFHAWMNWSHVHLDLSLISLYPSSALSTSTTSRLLLVWCGPPLAAYLLFVCLAFTDDAFEVYQTTFYRLSDLVRTKPSSSWTQGQPSSLVIHKLPIVDIKADTDAYDHNHKLILPSYSSSSSPSSTLSSHIEKRFRSHIPHDSPSTPLSTTSDTRIHISDEFPPSRPPTPPAPLKLEPPLHPTHPAIARTKQSGTSGMKMKVPGSPPYYRPFTSPTIYRMSASSPIPRSVSVLPGVQVTVHVQRDNVV